MALDCVALYCDGRLFIKLKPDIIILFSCVHNSDHVRYSDEIQCAAARIVQSIRRRAVEQNPSNVKGVFDSIHVRRGDFQYKKTRITVDQIYNMLKRQLPGDTTLYIATDEKDKRFFDDLKKHYHILFLDDFDDEVGHMNSNFFGTSIVSFMFLARTSANNAVVCRMAHAS